jgi:hypothetical protein
MLNLEQGHELGADKIIVATHAMRGTAPGTRSSLSNRFA